MDFSPDLISQLFGHRLQQEDIKHILDVLSSRERERFLDKIADIVGKLAALLEVANRVSDTLSLDTLLQRMVEIVTEVTAADRSTLFLNDTETNELFSRIALGELTTEIRFPNNSGIAGEVFTTGQAIIIPDAYVDARFNPEVDRKTGYKTRNILCTPIKTKERGVIGVVQVLNKTRGNFTSDDLSLLEAIASQAAAALLNAQLHEQVMKAREEETKLLEINSVLSSELNLGRLLDKIMETSKELLSADRCTLFLFDPKTRELCSKVAQGLETSEIRIPCQAGIAGSVFMTGQTINIPDAYNDRRFNQEIDKKTGYRTRSILCMPVINKDGLTIGVTQVLNKKGGPFGVKDEKRLKALSAQASIAIENAKMFEDILNMKNYNESMLESMSNGVVSLDADGLIVKSNAAALRILDEGSESLTGVGAGDYFGPNNQWILNSIDRVIESGRPDLTMDTDLVLAGGKKASVNLTVVPMIGSKNEFMGTLLILEDITSEKRLKGTMARYMTKEVADKLLAGGEEMLGGQAQMASVLFADIRSFTTIAEKIGPQATVSMLNEYFSIMVDIIFRYHGILDKYIGDAIMAVFGAPLSTGQDADNAVRAAIDMMRALGAYNRTREAQALDIINIGIGISTDEILSGNIGSLKRMDYTVIGDGVNLASRLEGANKYYGTHILVSEATLHNLEGRYITREIDRIRVKGKTRPVGVFQVLDYNDEKSFPNMEEVVDSFRQGHHMYTRGHWRQAISHFTRAQSLHPDDLPSRLYLERCQYFLQNPPAGDWDGVFVMETK